METAGRGVDPVAGTGDPVPALVEREIGAVGFDDGRTAQIADVQDDYVAVRRGDRERPLWEYDAHRAPPRSAAVRRGRVRDCHQSTGVATENGGVVR